MTKVSSDAQAFHQIRGRLEGDVGGILTLIDAASPPHPVPYWALVRMMFPVVEGIADLIYHGTATGTADALVKVLNTEFEAVRQGYAAKAALLTLLYRHSLTHQDEMRRIRVGGKDVDWQIAYSGAHLAVTKAPTGIKVAFGCKEFYADILAVLRAAEAAGTWGGTAMAQYNAWLECDLDAQQAAGRKLTKTERTAGTEVAAL